MKLPNLLEKLGHYVPYYPQLAKIVGGMEANILLSQLCYWQGKEHDPDGWTYQSQVKIEAETGLSADSQRTARAKLIERGLIEERYANIPRRLEFRIVPGAIKAHWDNYLKNQVVPPSSDRRQHNYPSPQCIEARRKNPISSSKIEQYQDIESSDILMSDDSTTWDQSERSLSIYPPNYSLDYPKEHTQEESVCVKAEKTINQELQIDPHISLVKTESFIQTNNPSSRPSFAAAGSFKKTEQPNNRYNMAQNIGELIETWITDPQSFADEVVPVIVRERIRVNTWVLPWHSGERKLNTKYQNFKPELVNLLAQELAIKSKQSWDLEITHAIAVINCWEKTKGGWTNLKQRCDAIVPVVKVPEISFEDAIAIDTERRGEVKAPEPQAELTPEQMLSQMNSLLKSTGNLRRPKYTPEEMDRLEREFNEQCRKEREEREKNQNNKEGTYAEAEGRRFCLEGDSDPS